MMSGEGSVQSQTPSLYVFPEDNRLENSGMLDAINKHSDDGITELLPDIAKEVDVFVGDAPQFDDLTMMVIRYRGKQEE